MHGLGRRGKEMASAVPVYLIAIHDQTKIGLVDKSGRLERLTRAFLETLGRELAELVVDKGQ